MLFRQASKKLLTQIHNSKTQDRTTHAATSPHCAGLQPPPSLGEKKGKLRPWPLGEGHPPPANTFIQRKKSPGQVSESFEIKESHSFGESCVTGSYTRGAVHLVQGEIQTNRCHSDSSDFLEELFVPSLSQKGLSGPSGGGTGCQSNEKPGSPLFHTSPCVLLSSSLALPSADKSVLSSPCPTPGHLATTNRYREEVEQLVDWCKDNNLILDVDKTNDIIEH
ncbi:uncharacterized protein LOC143314542 [Chaetodon auriga]|uniref:uncharacterized protein LOC143314542 n=1 Tax=Chaetodon auriga TaxID=39042 RepID=UPI004032FA87